MVTTDMIRELRERTGAGILDAKKALEANGGDIDKAIQQLREQGLAKAAKKAMREAAEGRIYSYIHGDPGRVGVLVEVNCETDFVARTPVFQALCHSIALQIAAASPSYVSPEEIPADVLENERYTLLKQIEGDNKPDEIKQKIVNGKIEKWYTESVLLRQPFIKDDSQTVQDMVMAAIAELGENIVIRRFSRFVLGEKG
ncbi:MAG: translation elongation factor Ts [Anaerolineae bacterium]